MKVQPFRKKTSLSHQRCSSKHVSASIMLPQSPVVLLNARFRPNRALSATSGRSPADYTALCGA